MRSTTGIMLVSAIKVPEAQIAPLLRRRRRSAAARSRCLQRRQFEIFPAQQPAIDQKAENLARAGKADFDRDQHQIGAQDQAANRRPARKVRAKEAGGATLPG